MTRALHYFSAAIFGWIPDVTGLPPRRQVTLGLVLSVLLHVLVAVLIALLMRKEAPPKISFAKPKMRARTIELTIMDPEPEPDPIVPFTMAPPVQPFIDSLGLDLANDPAFNPIFQSDENMRAASQLPAAGDAPLPSQEGRDRPFNAFKTQKSLLGMVAAPPSRSAPNAPSVVAPPAPQIAQQKPPPPPEPPPAQEPAPPKPQDPIREVITPREDEIALTAKTTPIPEPPVARPPATPRTIQQQARLITPAPRQQMARESGYQPEQEQNRIQGSISNRGRNSVDSVATPLGKFRKQVNSLIGSRWTQYVQNPPQAGLYAFGTAQVVFYISREGKVEGLKVLSNTANPSYAQMCLTAISDARRSDADSFRPPEGALEVMRDGRLEYFLTFTYYSY